MLLPVETGEATALAAEFKLGLNAYLKKPVTSPVRSLAEVIARNKKLDIEKIEEFSQDIFLAAQVTNGIGNIEKAAWFENVTTMNKLNALVIPRPDIASVLTIGGFQESMFLQDMIMKVFLLALILED